MKKSTSIGVMLGIALAFGALAPAHAVPITQTINLDTVYAGNTPDGPPPWLTATFSQTGSTTGTLTLISKLSDSDFLQGLNSKMSTVGWAFYLNQSLASLTCTSGTCADNNVLFGGSYNSGPVPGTFNLAFGWSSGNRFNGNDTAVYDLTFANALTGNPFAGNQSNWWSVAHVQGITGECSGWIVSGDGSGAQGSGPCTTSVPEPASLGIFGIGALTVVLLLGLRRRIT